MLLNTAMVAERSEYLGARPYERSESRSGYASGCKDKTVKTRQGALPLKVRRGRCPGNAIGDAVRRQALAIIRAHYIDFGPTFAHEKLTELHACHCSVETLRKWMIKDGLWLGKQRKKAVIHQSRPRRPRLGELVQIDGSPHDWFEGRGPRCTLMVFIRRPDVRPVFCRKVIERQ